MDQPSLPLAQAPQVRRRGRPPGAKSKRSLDLARYIEATFAGQTPGQQAAQLCMVTPKDLKQAKRLVQDLATLDPKLQLVVDHMEPLMAAMVVKARMLAMALSCDPRDAWLLLQKEREGLMAYVHQKQAPKADGGGAKPIATVFMVSDGEGTPSLANFSDAEDEPLEMVEVLPPAD